MDRSDNFKFEMATGEDIYPLEADNLQTHGAYCTKNPGHKGFIPVTKFGRSHLPREFQDEDVLEWMKKKADLTVKIITKFVSKERPDKFLPEKNSKLRGKRVKRTSTGYCWDVRKCGNTAQSHLFCQCRACKQSGQPKTSWWEVRVYTAAHVVFDDEEAANTDVIFYYDDTDSHTITIQGTRVEGSNVEWDRCELVCVVHDGNYEMDEEMNKLEGLCQDVESLAYELYAVYHQEGWSKLCVIISHPHGSTKQVSVGEWLGVEYSKNRDISYNLYTTPTCPGSSGAGTNWYNVCFEWSGFPHHGVGSDGLGMSRRLYGNVSK